MSPTDPDRVIDPKRFDAVIFDLDGVVTRTARVHAAAWKQMFDEFLLAEGIEEPFDAESDYRRYVDGKPRYDGVKSFLESRGIHLPWGDPSDPPARRSICGLGNRKNALFLEHLHRDGVETFPSSLDLIRRLREAGPRPAVVTSSRNGVAVLRTAGIEDLFDARVDGEDAEREALAGKPAPDIYLAACRRLGVTPARAVVIEDAQAGVAAASRGGFGLVVGVDRDGQSAALREQGADVVVKGLGELELAEGSDPSAPLPSAMDHLEALAGDATRRPAVFLDYDGTLTPIVATPDQAVLSPQMQRAIQDLAELCPVAVISGRDLDDVRARVRVADIWYAGSHGLEIIGPDGQRMAHPDGERAVPELDLAEQRLQERIGDIAGALLERKRYALAVHYRQVDDARVDEVRRVVDQTLSGLEQLRLTHGKKVFELRPAIDWDKGRAMQWLLDTLDLHPDTTLPIYVGDDETDEDAFAVLADEGIGIVVAERPRRSRAHFRLRDPVEVHTLLESLTHQLASSRA